MPADLNDFFNKKKVEERRNGGGLNFEPPNFGKFQGLIYALILIVVVFVVLRPFVIINSGEVGIKSTFGKYDKKSLDPGFHIFVPFAQQVIVVDTRVRTINYTTIEGASEVNLKNSGIIKKDAITVLDARNLPVNIDITIQYRLNPEMASNTIANWGLSWENKIVDPRVRDVVRNVVGQFLAEELPSKRDLISKQIGDSIKSHIESLDNRPVDLVAVQLREIILPAKVKEQIERVQIAKQEAERTKYEVEKANQEALKKAALAKGVAEAVKIEAQGRADARKIEADAEAYANKEVALSLDANLLQLKQIETQAKFNDALRENKDAKIFLTPGGSVPNIWVDTKDAKKQSAINENN